MAPPTVRIKFQPIIDLKSWKLAGFEALARFQDGRSPLTHLNKARRCGMLTNLEVSLAEAAIEEALGFPFPTIITINVSEAAFLSNRLRELVAAPHHRWGLELLETSPYVEHVDLRTKATDMGCILLVDDAGVDFSDEERIRTLAPHVVKIARGVFTSACTDGVAFERLYELVKAGREAGSLLLAEGIESSAHLVLAKALKVDFVQGYFFGEAVASCDVSAQLTSLAKRMGIGIPDLPPNLPGLQLDSSA